MNATPTTGPQPTDLPATDGHVVRPLLQRLQQLTDVDGSDALALFGRRIVAAAEQYLIDVQASPETAAQVTSPAPNGSPTVRANEHILQGALAALSIDGLDRAERDRLTALGHDAARRAGMGHLVIGASAEVIG